MKAKLKIAVAFGLGCVVSLFLSWLSHSSAEYSSLLKKRDALIAAPDLQWLSDECVRLLKMGASNGPFPQNAEKGRVAIPPGIELLQPKGVYLEAGAIFVVLAHSGTNTLAIKCEADGSLWLLGSVVDMVQIFPRDGVETQKP